MAQPPEAEPPKRERVPTWLNMARSNLERMIAEQRAARSAWGAASIKLLTGSWSMPRPGAGRRRRRARTMALVLACLAVASLALTDAPAFLWRASAGVRARVVALLQDRAPEARAADAAARPAAAPSRPERISPPAAAGTTRDLEADDIVDTVRASVPTLAPCLEAARSAGAMPRGSHKLILNWTVRPDGGVSDPEMIGPSHLLGTSLPACVTARMRRWSFPASRSGAPVKNFPLGPLVIK